MRFPDWAARRDWQTVNVLPAHQRLMMLLSMAGRQGMSRGDIGSLVGLPADELDNLLAALVLGAGAMVRQPASRRLKSKHEDFNGVARIG